MNNAAIEHRGQHLGLWNVVCIDLKQISTEQNHIGLLADSDGTDLVFNAQHPRAAQRVSFYAATIGLNWKPTRCLRIRPELRWDWFEGQGLPFDSRDGGTTGNSSDQFTAGLDVIIIF